MMGLHSVMFLRRSYGRDHVALPMGVELVQDLALPGETGVVCNIVDDDQDVEELFVAALLEQICDFVLHVQYVC